MKGKGMRRGLYAVAAALFLIGGSAAFAAARQSAAPIVFTPQTIKWVTASAPLPPTVSVAVLEGVPAKPGEYTLRLHIPDGTLLKPHWHSSQERVTVIQGTLLVGIGTRVDKTKMVSLPAGSYGSIPADLRHYAMAKGDTIIQINGEGPREMTPVVDTH